MKLLIAYTSKNGVAKRCAEMLEKTLSKTADIDVVDLLVNTPDPSEYDAVVLGGSIRFGSFNKKLKVFLKNNKEKLTALPCAVYICCGLPHRYDEYAEIVLPRKFYPSLGVHHFGGELKPERVKGFDKMVIKSVRASITNADFENNNNQELSLPEIIPENINLLAEELKKLQ